MDGPRWELEVLPGRYLPEGLRQRIGALTVTASSDGADELQIDAYPLVPGTPPRWLFGPQEPLAVGSDVVVWAGYDGELTALQRFRITSHELIASAGSTPKLTIAGHSAWKRLVDSEVDRTYPGPISDSEIVTRIGREHGLVVDGGRVESTAPRAAGRVKEKGKSDADFLRGLAFAAGFGTPTVRYNPDTRRDELYWRTTSARDQAGIATFRMLGDRETSTLLDFSAGLDLATIPTSVEVVGWDASRGEAVRVVVSISALGQEPTLYRGRDAGVVPPEIRSGSAVQLANLRASSGQTTELREVVQLGSGAPQDAGELAAWARRWLDTRNTALIVGRATTIGYEQAWVGQVHRFEGIHPSFEGLYEATMLEHRFESSGGYTCSWDLQRVLDQRATYTEQRS